MTNQIKQEEVVVEDTQLLKPQYLNQVIGSIETVTAVPTGKPTKLVDQFKFYSTGGVFRLYVYDAKNNAWKYTALT